MIDLYCERTAPGLWAEPFNTISNIAFFLAAWAVWRLASRRAGLDVSVGLLVILLVAIGVGSTLFHMFANSWSEWFDVIPITLFQLSFIWFYLRQVAGMKALPLLILLAAFLGTGYVASLRPAPLNGSTGYLPALAMLVGLGVYHRWYAGKNGSWLLLLAAGLFTISLVFRTIDNVVCGMLPMGTHWLWHLLNGIVLYLALRAYIEARQS